MACNPGEPKSGTYEGCLGRLPFVKVKAGVAVEVVPSALVLQGEGNRILVGKRRRQGEWSLATGGVVCAGGYEWCAGG